MEKGAELLILQHATMARSAEAASAVNELLQLPDQDQQSLLDVIEEYFTVHTDDSDMSDDDMETTGRRIEIGQLGLNNYYHNNNYNNDTNLKQTNNEILGQQCTDSMITDLGPEDEEDSWILTGMIIEIRITRIYYSKRNNTHSQYKI